jgi:cell division protein FtsQ
LEISTSPPAEWFRSLGGTRRSVLIAGAAAVLVACLVFASRTSLLDARRIEVTGTDHVHRADLVRIAGVSKDTNVLWFDDRAAERRLEAEPWIANADVSASFPLTIQIAVTERTPVAVMGGPGGSLIAGDGTALGASSDGHGLARIDLGTVTTAEGRAPTPVGAARALGTMPAGLRSQVTRVSVLLDGTLELRLEGGTRIRFGSPDDIARKVETIRRVFAWADEEGSVIRTLSVVAPGAPAATLVR